MLDTLIRVTVKAHSDPNRPPELGPKFRYPRPGETLVSTVPTMHPRELAGRMLRARRRK